MLLGVVGAAAPDAHAAVWGPAWGRIGNGRNLGLGGFVGTAAGVSLKWFVGAGLSVGLNGSAQHYWWGRYTTWRGEFDLVWHATVAHGKNRWEMILGPGVGAGVGWWRDRWYDDWCNRGWSDRSRCWGPFGRALFNWSILIHRGRFDIFVEPSFVTVFIPGIWWDWDIWVGAHYYF